LPDLNLGHLIISTLHNVHLLYSSPKAQHGHDASPQGNHMASAPGHTVRRSAARASDGELTCGKPQNANSKHSLIARLLLEQLQELQHARVYGNQVSTFFGLPTPDIFEYFS